MTAGWALCKKGEWTLNSCGSNKSACRIFKGATERGQRVRPWKGKHRQGNSKREYKGVFCMARYDPTWTPQKGWSSRARGVEGEMRESGRGRWPLPMPIARKI